MTQTAHPTNRELLLPYLLPYGVYVGIAAVTPEGWTPSLGYAIRIGATGGALLWAWGHYVPLRGPRSPAGSVGAGVLAGALGTVLWVALARPFAPEAAASLDLGAAALRIVAATLLVPLFEEQLMRGYVLRIVLQWESARALGAADPLGTTLRKRSILEVEPGAWSLLAIAISTLVFTAGHRPFEWAAAVFYGLWISALWVYRRDLLSCVVAHAVTNLALGVYVVTTGAWGLW